MGGTITFRALPDMVLETGFKDRLPFLKFVNFNLNQKINSADQSER